MAELQLATLAAEAREAIDGGDFARAADACRRVLLRYPRWVEGYWLLGQILIESGYVAQARSCFEAVASAMPDDARAYEGLAAVAEQQHDPATAVAGLFRAIEVGETSQGVVDELHRLQQQAGYAGDLAYTNARVAHARLLAAQYEEADVAAERGLQEEPDRLDLLVVQASARLFGGDRRGAEKVCEHLLELSPDCLKALAILRYLRPVERSASLLADLDALDPEAQTLVWLRSQVTRLGYDADDLPSAPRLVRWSEDGSVAAGDTPPSRPLDRLIPELEEVWPQWLQEAARATPEAEAEAATPVPPPVLRAPAPADAGPGFLGDVNSLAREFETALQPATAEQAAPEAPAPEAPAPEAARSASAEEHEAARAGREEATAASVAEQPPPEQMPAQQALLERRPGDIPAEKAEQPPSAVARIPATSREEPAAAEEGAWRPSEPAAAAEPEQAVAAEPPAPPQQAVAAEAAEVPQQAVSGVAAATPQQEVRPAAAGAPRDEAASASARPDTAPPELEAADRLQQAQRALQEGDFWSAIDRYGEVLATLRAASSGKG